VIAVLSDRQDRDQLRGQPARSRNRSQAAFEAGEFFFKSGDGRVADAGVDVPVRPQREQLRGVFGGVEHEAGREVDGKRARAGLRVGRRPGMKCARAETEAAFAQLSLSPAIRGSALMMKRSDLRCAAVNGVP